MLPVAARDPIPAPDPCFLEAGLLVLPTAHCLPRLNSAPQLKLALAGLAPHAAPAGSMKEEDVGNWLEQAGQCLPGFWAIP